LGLHLSGHGLLEHCGVDIATRSPFTESNFNGIDAINILKNVCLPIQVKTEDMMNFFFPR
jgi:hypothetical protein